MIDKISNKETPIKHITLTVLLIITSTMALAADGWPKYLGPNGDGSVKAPGLFDGDVALEQLWSTPLGSGFSSVAVGNGKLYTMHVAGEMDALSCFDAATGKKLWSHEYGAFFPKVGGSEPGPLSTPALDGNKVYGLGARGELFCLEADSGKLVWSRDLVKELGAVMPTFGITTSPLVIGNHLILSVGDGKDKAITAFHKKTGKLDWHLGDETVTYQSCVLATLMGREQLLAQTASSIRGIDPTSGKVLWESPHEKGLQVIGIGDDMLLTNNAKGFTLYSLGNTSDVTALSPSDMGTGTGKTGLKEIWSNENLLLEFDVPSRYKGYLYGFKSRFLTCLNLETGEKVWSTRDAGRGMAILVDGHLSIISNDGFFRIVRATEKGYEERASLKVFEKSGLTEPTYADGVFYLRNYTHLTAVKVKK